MSELLSLVNQIDIVLFDYLVVEPGKYGFFDSDQESLTAQIVVRFLHAAALDAALDENVSFAIRIIGGAVLVVGMMVGSGGSFFKAV